MKGWILQLNLTLYFWHLAVYRLSPIWGDSQNDPSIKSQWLEDQEIVQVTMASKTKKSNAKTSTGQNTVTLLLMGLQKNTTYHWKVESADGKPAEYVPFEVLQWTEKLLQHCLPLKNQSGESVTWPLLECLRCDHRVIGMSPEWCNKCSTWTDFFGLWLCNIVWHS